MISVGRDVRVFVATQPIDFPKACMAWLRWWPRDWWRALQRRVFVFRSKRSDRLKLPSRVRRQSGSLATKWLEAGDFAWPPVREGTMRVTGAQLAMLIEGLGVVASGPEGDEAAEERLLNRPALLAIASVFV